MQVVCIWDHAFAGKVLVCECALDYNCLGLLSFGRFFFLSFRHLFLFLRSFFLLLRSAFLFLRSTFLFLRSLFLFLRSTFLLFGSFFLFLRSFFLFLMFTFFLLRFILLFLILDCDCVLRLLRSTGGGKGDQLRGTERWYLFIFFVAHSFVIFFGVHVFVAANYVAFAILALTCTSYSWLFVRRALIFVFHLFYNRQSDFFLHRQIIWNLRFLHYFCPERTVAIDGLKGFCVVHQSGSIGWNSWLQLCLIPVLPWDLSTAFLTLCLVFYVLQKLGKFDLKLRIIQLEVHLCKFF